MYFNCCCRCLFEAEIIKIDQSSHKMYSNNILNFQVSTKVLNARTKNVWKPIVCTSYILDIYDILIILNEPKSLFCIQLNRSKYCYVLLKIQ